MISLRQASLLADRTEPWERGKLLGFNDMLAGITGTGLVLLAGVALARFGVTQLAIGGAALAIAPSLWILWTTRFRRTATLI